ncbi:chorismate synthase [Fibrobacter sp. UWCM]|uniref:chorismate synthase n=1 Tax=Fibrobacter sp. UWCM TaxID=1896208 RepID=UPI00091CDA5B|nr:chorismate synthase [Fibrobacter sp. UWCM]SHG80287.1 chorismate synthase [Fibrobacter sp. UWCM]
MSSTFGKIFSVTTWGESHGQAVGAVLDGCPAGLPLCEADIQAFLDRRRPGQGKLTTARDEKDQVRILSGVFEGKTTGTPISFAVFNEDQRSGDYSEIAKWYRPGHADLCYDLKYGFRDYRGGGRSSARETIGRVCAGAVAQKFLAQVAGTEFLAWVDSVGTIDCGKFDTGTLTREKIEASPVRCPVETFSEKMEQEILAAKKDGDSVGGTVKLLVKNVPAALGEPVFDRLDALLAQAMLSIPACKGFEIGSGFAGTRMRGREHNDEIYFEDGKFRTRTNNAGGCVGGISNGADIECRLAFKPTATISQSQKTASRDGENGELAAKGRHDPCVAVRAPVIVESMAALVLADLYLQQKRNCL